MIKYSTYFGVSENGPVILPLFNTNTDADFEKTAAPSLQPEVVRYIEKLKPQNDSQYVLNIALGAAEWWGQNANADRFDEEGLVHVPPLWTGEPELDKASSKDWPYGYPTFYNAHAFQHHRNKDPSKALGIIELVTWNARMKRVDQIIRVDKDKCEKFGAIPIWDKLRAGEYLDLSMGSKVPFDTCMICTDWKKYFSARETYDPKQHKHPGEAILAFHKRDPIRGVAVTRKDYCREMRETPGKILSDGRRVGVRNDFPRFFDQSFVHVGADRTSKVMLHVLKNKKHFFLGYSAQEEVEDNEDVDEKRSSLKISALPKRAVLGKKSEIVKDILPEDMAKQVAKSIPSVERDLPPNVLDELGEAGLPEALSTTARAGIVLRPQEFQRIIIVSMGKPGIARRYDNEGVCFPSVDEVEPVGMSLGSVIPELLSSLVPLMASRSAFGPSIERRAIMIGHLPERGTERSKTAASPTSKLLRKIASAYNGYRIALMDFLSSHQEHLSAEYPLLDGTKVAFAVTPHLLTPLSMSYVKEAFRDETGRDTWESLR